MSEIAVRVEGLGKKYRVVLPQERHDTLRDVLAYRAGRFAERVGSLGRRVPLDADARPDHIWALRDVSFEVARGSAVGIIGANGAGKSTLLKILSQITTPTTGEVEIRGRVGSLLEVGTGFHSELTGRENTYLSGAILGMRRQEIDRKFDEIVDFSEVEQFIDTPVKHYSSGMYLRLAFAVAAHLEPEILIVDEVLAVGDASFQKKCLGKMSDVTGEGRTVLFVSHNMDAVQRLCTEALVLENGQVTRRGDVLSVISYYLSRNHVQGQPNSWIDLTKAEHEGDGRVRVVAARYRSGDQTVSDHIHPNGPVEFELVIESDRERPLEALAVSVWSQLGTKLVSADTRSRGEMLRLRKGTNRFTFRIEALYLNPGMYGVGLWMANAANVTYDRLVPAFDLEVLPLGSTGLGKTPKGNGLVTCQFSVEGDHALPADVPAPGLETVG
jgi:lipopolysaccharide transport system ATP-binding protein